MSRRLKGGKPRRFKDHRRKEAKAYNTAYHTIAERYPPKDKLGAKLIALAADLMADYESARLSRNVKASARRKTAGLLLGALRVARDGAEGRAGEDLAVALAELHQGHRG